MASAKPAPHPRGIFERPNGSGVWWARYVGADGREHREKAGTRGMAQALYRKRKTEALQGKKLPERLRARAVTFADLAKDALAYSKAHNRSHKTDAGRLAELVEWFGNRPAAAITPQDIEARLGRESETRQWRPATANRYRNTLSLAFRLGMENGKVSANPARLVRARRENNVRIRYLDQFGPDEEARLRAAIRERCPEHLPEFDLALNTGMRLSEQYGLTWDRVDLTRQTLTVPPSKYGEARGVPLNAAALAAVRELDLRMRSGPWVVVNARGERMRTPRKWFRAAVEATGLREFTWHCLRHTFASRLVMMGVDLRTVQELMGHKDIRMTCRYAHLAPGHKLGAVELLGHWGRKTANETGTTTGTGKKSGAQATPDRTVQLAVESAS
jgi:integrase